MINPKKNQNLRKMSWIGYLLFILFFLVSVVHAAIAPHVRPISPRVQAMGGAFVGLANDSSLLFYNPAGILYPQKQGAGRGEPLFTVMDLGWRGYVDYLREYKVDAADLALGLVTPFEFLDRLDYSGFHEDFNKIGYTMEDSIQGKTGKFMGASTQGPLHLSYLERGWGVSFYSGYSDFNLRIMNKAMPTTYLYTYSTSVLQVAYGHAFKLGSTTLYTGVSAKMLTLAYIKRWGVDALSNAAWPMATENEGRDPLEEMVAKEMFVGYGAGLDFGLIWQLSPSWQIGLAALNAPTMLRPEKGGERYVGDQTRYVAPVVTLGTVFEPYSLRRWLATSVIGNFFTTMRLLLDYEVNYWDLTYTWNFWKGWHLGLETAWVKWHGRERLFLRGGVNQGYWTGGVGLDFTYFRVDYSYFVEEMGPRPGSLPQKTHNVTIKVEW